MMDARYGVGKRLLIGVGMTAVAVAAGFGGAPMGSGGGDLAGPESEASQPAGWQAVGPAPAAARHRVPAAAPHAGAAQPAVRPAAAPSTPPAAAPSTAQPVLVIAPLHAQGIVRTTAAGVASMVRRPATIHISFPRQPRFQSFEISGPASRDTQDFCQGCPGNFTQFAF